MKVCVALRYAEQARTLRLHITALRGRGYLRLVWTFKVRSQHNGRNIDVWMLRLAGT